MPSRSFVVVRRMGAVAPGVSRFRLAMAARIAQPSSDVG